MYKHQKAVASAPHSAERWRLWPSFRGLASRIHIAFLLAAGIPTSIAGLVGIFYSLDVLKSETLAHLNQEVISRTDGLGRFLDQLSSELLYLTSSTVLGELSGTPDDIFLMRRQRQRLEQDFALFARAYPYIYQIRYLDARGREVVRVDRRGGSTYVVPEFELQDKSDRYYVHETLRQKPGEIYISPLDLNIEVGKAEYPEKPVIRLGTPIADSTGAVQGLLIINLHAEILLDQVQQLAEARGGIAYLVNAYGFYLSRSVQGTSPPNIEMKALEELADIYPRPMLAKILAGSHGTEELSDWIIAFSPVRIKSMSPSTPKPMEWAIVLAFPKKQLFAAIFNLYLLYSTLAVGLAVTALAGSLLSRHLLRPLFLLGKETEAIARGDFASRVEIKGSDEIAELGERFNDMATQLQQSYAALERQKQGLEVEVKARTAALDRERQNLLTVIQSTADGILSLSDAGMIELANIAAVDLLHPPSGILVGEPISRYWPGWEDHVRSRPKDQPAPSRADLRLHGRTMALNIAPVTRDDICQGYILVVRDVSEERRLQDERRELDRQIFQTEKMTTMGELAMGLAHEIGNPLAGMKTVVQALLDEEGDDEHRRTYLQRIEGEIDRLSVFLRTFHGFAAPQETTPVSCRLEDVLEDVLLWTRREAATQGITIEYKHCAGPVPLLWADPNQLKQLLLNLVINAIHATTRGGRIVIGMCGASPDKPDAPAPRMYFCVEDTGVGIPPDVLPQIFAPFFTTRISGSGLGLAVVKKIALQHGAEIRVDSKPGCGTRFELAWPMAPGETATMTAPCGRSIGNGAKNSDR